MEIRRKMPEYNEIITLLIEKKNPSEEQIKEFQRISISYLKKSFENGWCLTFDIFRIYVEYSTLDAFALMLRNLCRSKKMADHFSLYFNFIDVGNYNRFKLIGKIMKLDEKISLSLKTFFLNFAGICKTNVVFECFNPFFDVPSQEGVDYFLWKFDYENLIGLVKILCYDCEFSLKKKREIVSLFLKCEIMRRSLKHFLFIEKKKFNEQIYLFSIKNHRDALIKKMGALIRIYGRSDIFSDFEKKIKNLKINYVFFVLKRIILPNYWLRLPHC